MEIRVAKPADVDAVLELWRRSAEEPTHTDDLPGVTRLLGHDPDCLIVAEVDGRIVGSVIATWDGWRGSIYRLVVADDHRRQGLASELLRRAENRLDQVGARRQQAIVVETSAGATGFWRASGWEEQIHRLRFVRG